MKIDEIQKQILDSLPFRPHGRLLLAPRVGKTRLMIDIIKRDKPESILWITPSAKLAKEDIPKEFKKWKADEYIGRLTTSTWASLKNIQGFFDMVIFDEEQHITKNNTKNIFKKTLEYNTIISMTGVPTKHKNKIQLYDALCLPILHDLSINDAVDIGILSNYNIKVLNIEMSQKKSIWGGNARKKFKTSEISQYNWMSKMLNSAIEKGDKEDIKFRALSRMRAIKNSESKLNAAKNLLDKLTGKILIFSSSIEQSQKLCEYRYHSGTNDTDLKRFQNGEIDRIAMVNSGGIGFTYKKLDHLVIVQADSNRNGLITQKAARALLKQKNYKATIWLICLIRTQDKEWVDLTLQDFDRNKVEHIDA